MSTYALAPRKGARPVTRIRWKRGVVLSIALLGAVSLNATLKTVQVQGESMMPTLQPGQVVLLAKRPLAHGLQRGDIVVISDWGGKGTIVKRVYRTEGEVVDATATPLYYWGADELKPFVVPKGCVYVLGDNFLRSEDSRVFGPVPVDHVIGTVVMR